MITFNQTSNTRVEIHDNDFDDNELAAVIQYVNNKWELNLLDGDYILFIEDVELILNKMKELATK